MFKHCQETCGFCNTGKYHELLHVTSNALNTWFVGDTKISLYFLDSNEANETQIINSSDRLQGTMYGLSFFITGLIILAIGILTLIVISRIF